MSTSYSMLFVIDTDSYIKFAKDLQAKGEAGFKIVPPGYSGDIYESNTAEEIVKFLEKAHENDWHVHMPESWNPTQNDFLYMVFIIDHIEFSITIPKYLQNVKKFGGGIFGELKFDIKHTNSTGVDYEHLKKSLSILLSNLEIEYGWLQLDWDMDPSNNPQIENSFSFLLKDIISDMYITICKKTLFRSLLVENYFEIQKSADLNEKYIILIF